MGSQNSFSSFQLWVLDSDYEDFLRDVLEIPLPQSYGHFFLEPESMANLEDMMRFQQEISIQRAKYLNPLLNDEDISIQEVTEVAGLNTEKARRVAEDLVSIFGQL